MGPFLDISSFSEKIGVQRSSISHILSGRNKPSLDFILKVLSSFPEVDLYWLLNGKGTFPSQENKVGGKQEIIIPKTTDTANMDSAKKEIKRIIIFYKDGSFEDFEK